MDASVKQKNSTEQKNREELVLLLYEHLLHRTPSEQEARGWTAAASQLPAVELVRHFVRSPEYRAKGRVSTFFPIGHFYSPVVDPSTIADYVKERLHPGPSGFPGVQIDAAAMLAFWERQQDAVSRAAFPATKQDGRRFHIEGGPFPYGDAASLHAILRHFRPKRIVEVGSGFSTACMLDSAELLGLDDLAITCVEPYPDRLKALLRPGDERRVRLLEVPVQDVPVKDLVAGLQANDILFIDSTHVLKTGSDVHYELFELVPALPPGCLVHIHDCPYPFEYPQPWLEDNYSWNEAYAVRAFLMYNSMFSVVFWGSLLKRLFPDKVFQGGGPLARNPGTSLWMRRTA